MENITAIMITRGDRPDLIYRSYQCFAKQTYPNKQLLIISNEPICDSYFHSNVVIDSSKLFKEKTLGWLRNYGLASSNRLCVQWDDDDIFNKDRIIMQAKALRFGKYAIFLKEQLHYFEDTNEVGWIVVPDGIEGTILFDSTCGLVYPDLPRGEDTPLKKELAKRNWSVPILCGTVYCRTFHGGNVWDRGHHIKRVHRFGKTKAQLKGVYHLLEKAAKEYNFKPGWKVIYGEN